MTDGIWDGFGIVTESLRESTLSHLKGCTSIRGRSGGAGLFPIHGRRKDPHRLFLRGQTRSTAWTISEDKPGLRLGQDEGED